MPGENVPLNIFELRYIELMKSCISKEIPFGICQILDGNETDKRVELEHVGCSAYITNWDMPQLGLYHIDVIGKRPFKIKSMETLKNGLTQAEVSWLSDFEDNPSEDSIDICKSILDEIFGKLNEPPHSGRGYESSPRWLSYRLTEFLASNLSQKQELLEERSDAMRLKKIIELLGLTPPN